MMAWWLRRACLTGGTACAALALAAAAEAQEIQLTGPLAGSTGLEDFVEERVASRHDAHIWLALGGTPAPEKVAAGFYGLGAQITYPVVWLRRALGVFGELRWGPWGQMWADGTGGRAEGGLTAQLYLYGRRVHSPVDIRLGGGYGEDALGRVPHVALTISAGPRYVEAVPWHETIHSEDGDPRTPQLIAGWRLWLSGRRTVEDEALFWVSGGVELELGFTGR